MKRIVLFSFLLSGALFAQVAQTEKLAELPVAETWTTTNSSVEAAEVDGQKVLRWTLETGKSATLALNPDHPLFSKLRYFDRLEFEFRIISGRLDFLDLRAMGHVSGARQFKIHQWQLAILTTEPGPWHVRQVDLTRPNWFPWDDKDGNDPHFTFGALAVEPGTVVELRDLRLSGTSLVIKPFFEYPITWPIRSENPDGSTTYTMDVTVLNTSGRPAVIDAAVISKNERFKVAVEPPSQEVKNGETTIFSVTATLSKADIAATPELYSEPVRVAFHNKKTPETVSTFEMPVTRPLSAGLEKQFVISRNDLKFIREKLAAGDPELRKALGIDRILAEANKFLEIPLKHIPTGRLSGRINYWPTVAGTKKKYEIGSFMPEIINPVTGDHEVGTTLAGRVWKEYLGHMGRVTEYLGQAYLFTGDEKYAKKAVELLELWASQYDEQEWTKPQELAWSGGPAVLCASRIAASSTYGSNWIMRWTMRMLGMIGDSPSLTPEARKKIYDGFVLPYATEIAKFPGGISNMTDITNHNLLVMGLVFDDANLVRWALMTDPGLLSRLKDLDKDGFSSEGRPTNYHTAAMNEYLPSIAYLQNSGLKVPFPKDRLLAAVRMPFERATLAGVIPNIGDCGRGARVANTTLADELIALFPNEEWLLDTGRGSTLPAIVRRMSTQRPVEKEGYKKYLETKPRLFSEAGLAILRSGDTPETQIMTTLDYGRNPMHGHLDRNQITLSAFGKIFTHGTGTLYNAGSGGIITDEHSPLNVFCGHGSLAQNVVLVDAENQLPAIGKLLAWSDDPANQYAVARVNGIAQGVDHTRSLILRDGLVIVIDQVESDGEHTYDFVYHNFGKQSPGPGWKAADVAQPLAETANYARILDLKRLTGSGPAPFDLGFERSGIRFRKNPRGAGSGQSCPLAIARGRQRDLYGSHRDEQSQHHPHARCRALAHYTDQGEDGDICHRA